MSRNSKKYINPGVRVARAYYSSILGSEKDRRHACYEIKNSLGFSELCQAADYIDKNINERLKEQFFGNSLPKSYKDLGKCDFPYVSENFISEFNWTLIAIRKYSYQINLFLIYKEIYENHFLLGDYIEAEKYLNKIEEEICFSLWTLENRFLIKEFTQSSSDNKQFLSEFNLNNEAEGVTKSLAHYLSLRAEKTLSVNRFNSDLKASLSKMEGNKKEEHIDFYLFKLSFLNHLQFTKYVEIIAYDFNHSIIDRYLTLEKLLSNLLTTDNQMVNKIETEKTIKYYIINRINYLTKKINDPILFKLKLFAGEKMFSAFDETDSNEQIAVLDKYTTGFYQDVEEELRKILLRKPSQFDLYELYIKSLVFQNKPFQSIGDQKSIQNQILFEMYKIFSVSVNPTEAGINLLRIANNISSCVLSYGIVNFVFHQTKGKNERKLLSRLSFNAANPIINEIYQDVDLQVSYLALLKEKFPNSITIDFLSNKIQDIDKLLNFEKKLPEVKFKAEFAKALQNKKKFEEAATIWEYLIDNYHEIVPVLEASIHNLYVCYEALKKYDDCIKLFVDNFFRNAYIIEKIEVETLLQKIKDNRFKIVKASIELPIFYTIANADENETHTAFEKFNLSCGVCKPSELLSNFDNFDKQKIQFYLKSTCGPEILKHSIHIVGSKDRLEERLTICQFLREKDTEDKAFYDDEIKYISNILVIQKGLLELDESKIYVNEQGIIIKELKEYEAIYQRYKTIASIADKSKIFFLDQKRGTLTTLNYTKEKAETETIEYSLNPVFDIYKELFDAIKDKFLHSKFGIVAYLSTRIRHGVLLGEIRPIFEKHKLITLREGDTANYRKNLYWDHIVYYEPIIQQNNLQDLLKEFSYSIDGLIFDLIKKYLQVRDDKINKDGWFDYTFEDDTLFLFSIRALNSRDFNHFAQQVFEILWDRTDANLILIRQKIQNDIANEFNALFNKLEKDLVGLLGVSNSQVIINSIKACSTETQTVITRISSWFKRSGTSASDFEIENLIDIVMEYTNKTHPNKRIALIREINYNCRIKGEYLTHFADLLRIFTENILKHSDEKQTIVEATIKTNKINDDLEITIENAVTNQQSIESLKSVWADKIMDISKLLNEGKSGYHKAYKILQSDLSHDDNNFYTELNENEDVFIVTMLINMSKLTV